MITTDTVRVRCVAVGVWRRCGVAVCRGERERPASRERAQRPARARTTAMGRYASICRPANAYGFRPSPGAMSAMWREPGSCTPCYPFRLTACAANTVPPRAVPPRPPSTRPGGFGPGAADLVVLGQLSIDSICSFTGLGPSMAATESSRAGRRRSTRALARSASTRPVPAARVRPCTPSSDASARAAHRAAHARRVTAARAESLSMCAERVEHFELGLSRTEFACCRRVAAPNRR